MSWCGLLPVSSKYYVLNINPEPWAIGDVSAGRSASTGRITGRISPNPNLVAYQNAVREELAGVEKLNISDYSLTFFFWRQQARYLDAADRRRQRNQADATNLQKGLEDGLQEVLFDNDRDVKDIRSVIVDQGPKVESKILIVAEPIKLPMIELLNVVPTEVVQQLFKPVIKNIPRSKWDEADDLF